MCVSMCVRWRERFAEYTCVLVDMGSRLGSGVGMLPLDMLIQAGAKRRITVILLYSEMDPRKAPVRGLMGGYLYEAQ